MRILSIFTACLLITQLAATTATAEIFKTTDKQGRVVYTDQPAASDTKAKPVELRDTNKLPAVVVTPYTPTVHHQDPAMPPYTIEITSPAAGTTLLAHQRNLSVSVTLNQDLQAGHSIAYYIDANVAQDSTDLNVTLNEPPRGEHKLHAAVKDKAGKILAESASVTFIVMRPIVK